MQQETLTSIVATEAGPMSITFDRLPVDEQLYAVYCSSEGREHCFHMMFNSELQEFRIVDRRNCPYALHGLEHSLSKAIEHHHL